MLKDRSLICRCAVLPDLIGQQWIKIAHFGKTFRFNKIMVHHSKKLTIFVKTSRGPYGVTADKSNRHALRNFVYPIKLKSKGLRWLHWCWCRLLWTNLTIFLSPIFQNVSYHNSHQHQIIHSAWGLTSRNAECKQDKEIIFDGCGLMMIMICSSYSGVNLMKEGLELRCQKLSRAT